VASTPGRVAIKWLLTGWVTVCIKPSQYVTSHLDELSLPSLQGR